jgi:hypothetical protein
MKGDFLSIGDRVVLRDMGKEFNGIGGQIDAYWIKEGECPSFIIRLDDGRQVITCACYADRAGPPKLKDEWRATVKWENCAWKPHQKDLPAETARQIKALMAGRKTKSRGGK